MELKKTIRRIAALGATATMLGSTMMGAMAADLADYPAPFVKDGKFNAILVVGDGAASADVIGSVDIATSLQFASKVATAKTTGGTSVELTGDAKKLEESTNKLELGENLTGVRQSATTGDLSALQKSSINNEYGTHDYTQTVALANQTSRVIFAKDTSNAGGTHDDEVAAPYFTIPNGAEAYRFKISFSPALKSDHNTGGSGYLDDVRNKKMKLLGKEYSILKADHTATNNIALTFMAGAVSDILSEGESKTYTVAGKDYDVTLDFVGSDETKFTINGQITDALKETDTFKLTDGTEIGIVDILYQAITGGLRKVEFNLGANKIKLADTATNTRGTGGTVSLGSEDSSNVKVDIVTSSDGGTASGADVFISSIEVYYTPSEDLYVGAGEKASVIADKVEDEKGVFFLDAFDYKFEGLTSGATEEIKLTADGNDNYKLAFTSKSGVAYNDAVFANTTTGNLTLGRWTGSALRRLVVNETTLIRDEDYFVVSNNKYSRIMQFKDVAPGSNTTDSAGTVKVRDIGSGDLFEVSYASLDGDLNIDGNTFQINLISDASTSDILVDLNGDATNGSTSIVNKLWTKYEAQLGLNDNETASGLQSATGSDSIAPPGQGVLKSRAQLNVTSEQDEDQQRSNVVVLLTANSDRKMDVASSGVSGTRTSGLNRVGTTYVYEDYSYVDNSNPNSAVGEGQYGMFVKWDQKSSSANDQDDVVITYPDSQVFGNLFLIAGATTTVSSAVEGGTTFTVNPIEVGAAKLASEVANPKAQNVILVGGPCANAAAATIMGDPQPCTKDFTEGEAWVKLYENNGNVALLVAGFSALDTRRASRVVANYKQYAGKLKGKEVVVSGTTLTDITVAAPAPAAAAPAAAATTTTA